MNENVEIHIWDLLNLKNARITVDISNSLKEEIKNKVNENIFYFSKDLNIASTRLYEYFIWKKSQIPLEILFALSRKLNIPDARIEKNIISYKQLHVPSKNSIKNPILPIQITPYLTSIIANLFFDGSVPEDGKGTYYNQKNEQTMNDFIQKVKDVFGDVQYSLKKDHRGVLKCRVPRIIGEICRHIYSIDSFGTFEARLPKKLLELNEEHKISFILTGLIDEGSIAYDGSVIFGVSNKRMTTDFNNLCNELGLKTKGVKQKKKSTHYYIYIISIDRLNQFIDTFSKEYPLISLHNKAERLKKYLEIKNKKYFNTKIFAETRKNLILNELKQKDSSVNVLSNKFLIPPRTIRRYFYRLIREGKIKRRKIGSEFVYALS